MRDFDEHAAWNAAEILSAVLSRAFDEASHMTRSKVLRETAVFDVYQNPAKHRATVTVRFDIEPRFV